MPELTGSPAVLDVLRAVAHDIRWQIVTQMADCDELACTTLEHTLPISKSTISYHIKILYDAGLIEIRREGKFFFYTLRRDVLGRVLEDVHGDITMPGQPSLSRSK